MSLDNYLTSVQKLGLEGAVHTYSPAVSQQLSSVGSSIGTATCTLADTALQIHNLYYGLGSIAYTATTSMATSIGLSGATALTLAGLSGTLVYLVLAYATYRAGKFAVKKTFDLTNFIIKSPFKATGKLGNKLKHLFT